MIKRASERSRDGETAIRSGSVGEGTKTEELDRGEWDEVDLEAMVEASGTNASSINDGTISTSDGDRSRKLFRAMKVFLGLYPILILINLI